MQRERRRDEGRLKREILGANGTLVCNYTPGPYMCDRNASDPAWNPVADCPCDGTNDERGGGNWAHEQLVDDVDRTAGDYLMLTHVPHGDVDSTLMQSIARYGY